MLFRSAESNPSLMRKTNTKGNTPLHDAVITDNKEVAKLLVSRDPEVAYYNNTNGKSPLYLAVENGNKKEILDDLLKTKASFPIKVKKVMPYQKESHLFMLPSSNVTEVITIS